MSENTKIEWADHTFNPWEGCQKVGPGCDHCYAEARNARFGGGSAPNWGPGAPRRRTSASNWNKPVAWNNGATEFMAQHGRRQRVFCASLADVFDNAVNAEWRADLLMLIRATPKLDWLLLTKRIGNVKAMLQEVADLLIEQERLDGWDWLNDWVSGSPPKNVWLGATVTSQDEYDRDAGKLIDVPAWRHFLSMEPLLGPVLINPLHFQRHPDCHLGTDWDYFGINWVIVGGESGAKARPMSIQWARSLRDQCAAAGVPFLFKQWGEWAPIASMPAETPGKFAFGDYEYEPATFVQTDHYPRSFTRFGARCVLQHVGKKAAGRLLDGRTWDEVPT